MEENLLLVDEGEKKTGTVIHQIYHTTTLTNTDKKLAWHGKRLQTKSMPSARIYLVVCTPKMQKVKVV